MGILVYKYTVILYHYFLSANFREYLRDFYFCIYFPYIKIIIIPYYYYYYYYKIYQAFENCLTSLDFLFQIVFL